jgi:predicted phosphodiesterase
LKYALISDIHGNLHALQAVIADAEEQGVQKYLFLGDYIEDLPWPNEVVETIQKLKDSIVIRGNKEDYLANLQKENQAEWVCEQFAPIYWNYRELRPENLEYLISLPKVNEIIVENGEVITLSHSSKIFYQKPKILPFHSSYYLTRMSEKPFTHQEYLEFSCESVLEHSETVSELKKFQKGIHCFGHNHLQWFMQINDTWHINPGSCGMPLDFNTKAPYTIIEPRKDGWIIEERRVSYDINKTIEALKASELYKSAKIWSNIMIEQLQTGGDIIGHFLHYVDKVAYKFNFYSRPVSNEIWSYCAETFDMTNLFSRKGKQFG